jgi:Protein of unknown function (DUF2800)
MSEHSNFPPSGAAAWLKCTGWLHYNATMPRTSSAASDRGTRLHDEAANRLTMNVASPDLSEDDEAIVAGYVDYVRSIFDSLGPTAQLFVEQRVHLNKDIWGTVDAFILSPGRVDVIDFKTGQHRVHARENAQLGVYAAAILKSHSIPPADVVLHVAQSSLGHYDSWAITTERVHNFSLIVETRVDDYLRAPEYVPSAEACRWCRGAAVCRARAEYNLAEVVADFTTLNDSDIAALVPKLDQIEAWVDAVRARAMELAECGALPGYSLELKPGNRQWADADAACKALEALGIRPKMSPVGIGAAEKVLGKEHPVFIEHTRRRESTKVLVASTSSTEACITISTTVKGD